MSAPGGDPQGDSVPVGPREARLREALASAIEHFIHFTGRRWHCELCDVTWVANQEQEHHREDCSIVAWRAALASPSPDETGVADAGASEKAKNMKGEQR